MKITIKDFNLEHLQLWNMWKEKDHVKNSWFLEGYEPPEKILEKIGGKNGHTYPFVIYSDNKPVGYIQCCDLDAYYKLNPDGEGVYKNDKAKSFCVDIFIGEEDHLGKGIGSLAVKKFIDVIYDKFDCDQILIDPIASNKAAIRCYEKAGFEFLRYDDDGVSAENIYVMRHVK